jgi:hypothetical protein
MSGFEFCAVKAIIYLGAKIKFYLYFPHLSYDLHETWYMRSAHAAVVYLWIYQKSAQGRLYFSYMCTKNLRDISKVKNAYMLSMYMSQSKPLAALFPEREMPILGYHKGMGLLLYISNES